MIESLTEREMTVLRAVAAGKSNKEIAEALFISVYTVQVHLRNIFGKLSVGSRTEAIAYALRQGWIRPGEEQ
jgi:DNA-binding NarL/FixJ family response regulator